LSETSTPTEFEPYIKAHQSPPEMTVVAIVLGLVQACFFGIADAYLALKLGLTVGASIPAAVISMSILRGVLKRGSILENNLVQNMASVGESLACGAAFTIPSLYILSANLTKAGQPLPFSLDILQVYFVACMGGLMGILFMIPLRRFLIVKEHGVLRYPEGTACAEVLMAGDQGGQAAKTVFAGIAVAGVYRFAMSGLGLFQEVVSWPVRTLATTMSFDFLPSLLAVGFILGIETCGVMVSGAVLGWFVIIPMISYYGHGLTVPLAPGLIPISQMTPEDIWSNYLRYIGAGAVAFGGLVSLAKSMPTIVDSLRAAFKELMSKKADREVPTRTSLEVPLPLVIGGWLVIFLLIGFNHSLNLSGFLGALLAVTFAFFFVTVSSRIVGIVGTTSMPLSGMTIGALLTTCLIVKWAGFTGSAGMAAALVVAAMVCIAISMGGDISQDLKIGFLVGATPKWVQITQMASVLVSSAVICKVLQVMMPFVLSKPGAHNHLDAPQANLLYIVTKGVIEGSLPWVPVFIGMVLAACVEMLGVGSLAFAVGLYLHLELSTTIVFGGLVNLFFTRIYSPKLMKDIYEHGLLLCSGFVAGDALVGVFLAVLAANDADTYFSKHFTGSSLKFHFWHYNVKINSETNEVACLMFGLLVAYLFRVVWKFARERAAGEKGPYPEPEEMPNTEIR
jgi:putative OPT family oligopeptide transporter